VERVDPGYSIYGQQQPRLEPQVERMYATPQTIPMYVPSATKDPGYSIYDMSRRQPRQYQQESQPLPEGRRRYYEDKFDMYGNPYSQGQQRHAIGLLEGQYVPEMIRFGEQYFNNPTENHPSLPWDPSLEPQVSGPAFIGPATTDAIPAELQEWADMYGVELTPKQIEQYNAIQAGGWR
jgi:hypothetical protein